MRWEKQGIMVYLLLPYRLVYLLLLCSTGVAGVKYLPLPALAIVPSVLLR